MMSGAKKTNAKKKMLAVSASILLLGTALTGCADYTNPRSVASGNEKQADSQEGLNRAMFDVNNAIDTVVLRPITVAYRTVVPEEGRTMVSNFVRNLGSPVTFVNSILQGDQQNTFATFWRFAINSTVGIGGVFDVAAEAGLRNRDADFGQTMAVWGVGSGPYVFIPVIGPSTLRDTVGRVVDIFFNPLVYLDEAWPIYAQAGITLLDRRSQAHTLIDDTFRTSLDPYATFRSGYLQRRSAEIARARAVHHPDAMQGVTWDDEFPEDAAPVKARPVKKKVKPAPKPAAAAPVAAPAQ